MYPTRQVLEKLERPVLVYDVHHMESKREPCPIFSTGHVEDSGEDHREDDDNEHDNTPDPHDGDQEHSILITKDKIYKRHQLFPTEKYHRTFFVWATDAMSLSAIMDTLNSTAMICPQKVDGGVFHLQTRYILSPLRAACSPKRASIYDVRKILQIFFTPSPLVMYRHQLILFLSSAFWGPPSLSVRTSLLEAP